MKKVHLLLTGLSVIIILLSLNRLTNLTLGYLQPHDFLRWVDFNAMLPIPLASIILYYLLKKDITQTIQQRTSSLTFFNILFITGIYFFAAGSGDHEVTNYLNARFCDSGEIITPLCQIISYNDDTFSHLVYYLGFILLNVSLMLIEYLHPRPLIATTRDLIFIGLNSFFIALGIFANLAFEETVLDLIFFSGVMLVSLYLAFFSKNRFRSVPVTFYFATAYTLGVVATLLYKLAT